MLKNKKIKTQYLMTCFISGQVQGVCFRAYTQQKARQFHLTGSAINLADGRVEVNAYGSKENLTKLKNDLKVGSPLSNVTKINCQLQPTSFTAEDFSIG